MTTAIRTSAIVVLIVGSGLVLLLAREQQAAGIKRTDRATTSTAGSTRGASPRETITVVANEPIPNLLGKRVVSRVIDYPPGGGSTPHRHARSAFIYAYVLSGLIRSQVDDEPARVYRPGETWFESPGTTKIDGVDIHFIHVRSRQANALPLIMTHGSHRREHGRSTPWIGCGG